MTRLHETVRSTRHQRDLTSRERELLDRLPFDTAAAKASFITVHRQAVIVEDAARSGLAFTDARVSAALAGLTRAERELVALVRRGWSNKEIAACLGKSVRTVKTQLTSVCKKFSVRTRSRLLAILP